MSKPEKIKVAEAVTNAAEEIARHVDSVQPLPFAYRLLVDDIAAIISKHLGTPAATAGEQMRASLFAVFYDGETRPVAGFVLEQDAVRYAKGCSGGECKWEVRRVHVAATPAEAATEPPARWCCHADYPDHALGCEFYAVPEPNSADEHLRFVAGKDE